MQQRLKAFEADNQSNAFPIQAVFRIDAGFGTRENVAWLIEMGYEVYTKPYSDWLTPRLKLETHPQTNWMPVGSNAEMIAWKNRTFADFPYPLDVGLERFYTGKTQRFGTLIHFGQDPVTTDLPTWFHHYNARQMIEAGIKEGKNVFAMHHLKVRSAPAIFLQEQFAVFAANFVRWAARWLREQCPQLPDSWLEFGPTRRERASSGRSAYFCLGDLARSRLFVKVHGPKPVCWSVPFCSKAMGGSVDFAVCSKCCFLTFKALCSLIAQNLR